MQKQKKKAGKYLWFVIVLLVLSISLNFIFIINKNNKNKKYSDLEDSLSFYAEKNSDLFGDVVQTAILGGQNFSIYDASKYNLEFKDLIITDSEGDLYLNNDYIEDLRLFRSGFSGKVNNQNITKDNFRKLLKDLFVTGAVDTYEHVSAEGQEIYVDKNNPTPKGMTIEYEIKHKYCTNKCQTATYELDVELNNEGEFIGYNTSLVYN